GGGVMTPTGALFLGAGMTVALYAAYGAVRHRRSPTGPLAVADMIAATGALLGDIPALALLNAVTALALGAFWWHDRRRARASSRAAGRILTAAQVAEVLRTDEDEVLDMVASGELPALLVDLDADEALISEGALREFIAA